MLAKIGETEKVENFTDLLNLIDIFSQAHLELKNAVIPSLPLEVAIAIILQTENNISQKKNPKLKNQPQLNTKKSTKNEEKKKEKKKNEEKDEEKDEEKNEEKNEKEEKEEKPKEDQPDKTSNVSPNILNKEEVEKKMLQIRNKIQDPGIKGSLMFCNIDSVQGDEVILVFSSKMMKEKSDGGIMEIYKAFEEVFGRAVKVMTKLSTIPLEPINIASTSENKKENGLYGDDLEKTALAELGIM